MEVERDLQNLILEMKENYSKIEMNRSNTEAVSRAEFDSVHEGLSGLHFHLTLFLLLTMLALLNIPSVITWANDYQ